MSVVESARARRVAGKDPEHPPVVHPRPPSVPARSGQPAVEPVDAGVRVVSRSGEELEQAAERLAGAARGHVTGAPAVEGGVEGVPLAPSARARFEEGLGADLSGVRVRSGPAASAAARRLNAAAFTVGEHITLGESYRAGTASGDRLLTHELAHVALGHGRGAPETAWRQEAGAAGPGVMFNSAVHDERWSDAVRALAEMPAADRRAALGVVNPAGLTRLRGAAMVLDPTGPLLSELDSAVAAAPPIHAAPKASAGPDLASMSGVQKLARAVEFARQDDRLDEEMRRQIGALFTPEAIASMVFFAATYVAAQLTPAGWIADGIALITITVSAFFLSFGIMDFLDNMARFVAGVDATTDAELHEAGHALVTALVELGLAAFMALVTHTIGQAVRSGGRFNGPPPSGHLDAVATNGQIIRMPVEATAAVQTTASAAQSLAAMSVMPPPSSLFTDSSGSSGSSGSPVTEGPPPPPEADFADITHELGLEPPRPEDAAKGPYSDRVADAEGAGLMEPGNKPGTVDVAVGSHQSAPALRDAHGVSGSKVESAHVAGTGFVKEVPGYSRSRALTTLLDRSQHLAFDNHWKHWVRQQRAAGRVTATVAEIEAATNAAIDQTPGLSSRTKGTLSMLLRRELYSDLGLTPTQPLPLPKLK